MASILNEPRKPYLAHSHYQAVAAVKEENGAMPNLPDEIIFNILLMVPAKYLVRFRCVCKAWFELFRNPGFIKKQLNHANEKKHFTIMLKKSEAFNIGVVITNVYTMDYDPSSSTCDNAAEIACPLSFSVREFQFWGSCNGLFCINSGLEQPIILWNPSTREYKEIPAAPFYSSHVIDHFEYGFGYDCKIDDYKVIRLVGFYGNHWCEAMVYTLSSNSWRSMLSIPYELCPRKVHPRGRVTVNGTLHWLATRLTGSKASKASKVILCFDLVDERFREMSLPNSLHDKLDTYVTVLGGALCVLSHLPEVSLDVWEMKDYGVLDSWSKLFTIDQQTPIGSFNYLTTVQSFDNGAILLAKNCNDLVLYEPENETATNLYVRGNFKWSWDTCVYVGSLVSLNSGTYATTYIEADWNEVEKRLQEEKNRKLVWL